MGERTSYAPGTFCWVDLGARDPNGAAAFYAAVLGWEITEPTSDEHGAYRTATLRGHAVAGVWQGAAPVPAWTSYVSVEDVDAAAARATELGATVAMGPVQVGELGRSALVHDPQGAAVGLWEPGAMIGATLVNAPGALSLNQLNTTDAAGVIPFYTGLFGWEVEQVSPGPQPYWGIRNRGVLNGGIMEMPAGNPAPPHWLPYFTVQDIDAADALIVDAGGKVVVPVMPAGPEGRILVAMDPEAAAFALWEGRVDP